MHFMGTFAHKYNRLMKKIVSIFLTAFSVVSVAFSQGLVAPVEQWDCEEVNGFNYHGFAFNETWDVDFTIENQDGRYTLTSEDIMFAEKLIQSRLAFVNRNHENQDGMCPIIDEHILNYARQYVGFTDMDGYRIAWVNFLWDDTLTDATLAKDVLLTEGGCGHFFHLKVNLDTKRIYGLEVNEIGDVRYLPRKDKRPPRISRPQPMPDAMRVRKTGIIHTQDQKKF